MFDADVFRHKKVPLRPKFKPYIVNGTGRDSYINSSFKSVSPRQQRWNFDLKKKSLKNFQLQPKINQYHPDDTGRDFYLIKNNGGFSKVTKWQPCSANTFFKNSLRSYEIQRPSTAIKDRSVSKNTSSFLKRMSTPKHTLLIKEHNQNPLKKLKGKMNFFIQKKGFRSDLKENLQQNKVSNKFNKDLFLRKNNFIQFSLNNLMEILNEEDIKNECQVFDINLVTFFEYHQSLKNVLSLSCLKSVRILNLKGCGLEVFHEIGFLKNLFFLDLSQNELFDIRGIYQLENLQFLKLEGNNLKEKSVEKIKDLQKLKSLSFQNLDKTLTNPLCKQDYKNKYQVKYLDYQKTDIQNTKEQEQDDFGLFLNNIETHYQKKKKIIIKQIEQDKKQKTDILLNLNDFNRELKTLDNMIQNTNENALRLLQNISTYTNQLFNKSLTNCETQEILLLIIFSYDQYSDSNCSTRECRSKTQF